MSAADLVSTVADLCSSSGVACLCIRAEAPASPHASTLHEKSPARCADYLV